MWPEMPQDRRNNEYPYPNLLKRTEATKRLGISPQTLERLVRDGEIVAVEYYSKRRYTEESVISCLERHVVKTRQKEIWPGVVYKPGMKIV